MSVALKPPGPVHSHASPAPAHSIAEPFMSSIVMLHCPNASCARVAISVHTAIAIRTRAYRPPPLEIRPGRDEARRGHMGPAAVTRRVRTRAALHARATLALVEVPSHGQALGDRAHARNAS